MFRAGNFPGRRITADRSVLAVGKRELQNIKRPP